MDNISKKKLFIHFLFVISIFLILGSTYAWVTGKDERINRVDAPLGELSIKIEGNKNALTLSPGDTHNRNISVRNKSEQSVFVRVSLKEIMAIFNVDTTDRIGNAHLKNFNSVTPKPEATFNIKDTSTWIQNDYYQRDADHLLQATQIISYDYKEPPSDRPDNLKYITVGMPNVKIDVQTNNTPGYWLYYDNYFYYSTTVLPTNLTNVLITDISIPSDMPNRLKGSLYNIEVDAEGVLRNSTVFDAWNIPKNTSNPVYNMLNKELN